MNPDFQTLMQHATGLTREGRLAEATAALQRALRGDGPTAAYPGMPPDAQGDANTDVLDPMVIDGCVFEVDPSPETGPMTAAFEPEPARPEPPSTPPAAVFPATGEFLRASLAQGPIKLAYKLYVPPHHAGRSLPLVVMLHGCTQHADDFAAGTRMNERAAEEGFFVLYPEQSAKANPQRCWNWFKHSHQARGRGEPAAIVAATQEVMHRYGIDARRVYIAGLSAGGAMAHIVASAYPEVFAAVGVHSGLPRDSARNVSEALAAMKSGSAEQEPPRPAPPGRGARPAGAVPTIVFHGDHDKTVHPRNGEQVMAQAMRDAQQLHGDGPTAHAAHREQGVSVGGRPYTRRQSRDAHGRVIAEHWLVHGAGHAWLGGSAAGSYTDARGPDATGEMLRFFRDHPRD